MANTFFEPGGQRGERVKVLFARIAPRYDLINDLQSFGLHRRWKRLVVELARVTVGQKALDVCCGTGDLALALAGRGAEVTGLDFSEPMLQQARRRAGCLSGAASPKGSVNFVSGDAQQLPFADSTFDIVTVGYGLRNLADWRTGLREMCRVCKPGGRVLVLDFGKPDNPVWLALYFTYLRCFVPLLGLIFAGSASAYAYILESLKHYPAQHGVADFMRQTKLVDVGIINLMGGVMTINCGQTPPVSLQTAPDSAQNSA